MPKLDREINSDHWTLQNVSRRCVTRLHGWLTSKNARAIKPLSVWVQGRARRIVTRDVLRAWWMSHRGRGVACLVKLRASGVYESLERTGFRRSTFRSARIGSFAGTFTIPTPRCAGGWVFERPGLLGNMCACEREKRTLSTNRKHFTGPGHSKRFSEIGFETRVTVFFYC